MEKFTQAVTNLHSLITDSLIASIAGILVVVCGLYISFGNIEKGKTYAWSIIVGISIVYAATSIVNTIWA